MPTIVEQAEQRGIDPFVFSSLIFHESAFRPRVVSSAGACGLSQVLPQYSDYTCDQLKKPKTSIKAGMIALSYWLTRAKGDLVHGLCGYNAGNVCINNKRSVRVRHVKRAYSESIINLAIELRLEVVDRFMDDRHRFYNKVTDDNID
jgi:soluble lytic murein transglycosylase-like protein